MLLAQLDIRHTRRHMPTRRVALGEHVLPMGHPGYGAILLGAVMARHVTGLDEEQAEALGSFMDQARTGLVVPRRALRFRLQTDTEGLALSRHRLFGEDGGLTLELDLHSLAPVPQVLGAVMAAAEMAPYPRRLALTALRAAVETPDVMPDGITMREIRDVRAGPRPPTAPLHGRRSGVGGADGWHGVPVERRWAMEVLGFGPEVSLGRDDVLRRFRRLVRMAHPDHGGALRGAAERIVELGEARRVLLEAGAPPVRR